MKKLIILGMVMTPIFSCSKQTETAAAECSGDAKSYAKDVSATIQNSCATNPACHAAGSYNGPGALLTYAQVYQFRLDIRHAVANGSMPEGSSLSATERNDIL